MERVSLRHQLEGIGSQSNRVIGVQWSLEYVMKTKRLDKIDEPVFLVKLDTSEKKGITFEATLQQMQDMLAKINDAVKSVERILHSSNN